MAKEALGALGKIKRCPYCQKRLDEIEACAKNAHRFPFEPSQEVSDPFARRLIDDGHLPVVK